MDDVATACPSCGTPNVAEGAYAAAAMGGTSDRASFGQRLVAYIVDQAIFFVVYIVLLLTLDIFGALLSWAAFIGYTIYLHGSPSGQTVGKRVMNIRVIREDGGPLGYGAATGRFFATILSSAPCSLGYLWMLWDDQKQTWHDKLARTNVVTTDAHPVTAWPG